MFANWPKATDRDGGQFNGTRNMTVTMRTLSRSGIIAYHGDNRGFIALELYQGRVKGTFYVGNYPPSHLYSYIVINDGRPHKLEAIIDGKALLLKIDSLATQAVVNSGRVDSFHSNIDQRFYIGGMPETISQSSLAAFHVKNSSSFDGCLFNLFINGQLKDFRGDVLESHDTMIGCALSADLCLGVDCSSHGKCQLNVSFTEGFECKCDDGFSGRECEKRVIRCVKERRHERLVIDDCRSVEVVKSAKCSGFCGDNDQQSCCVPVRTKRKKVKLICRNGETRTANVDIIRKCSCINATGDCSDKNRHRRSFHHILVFY